MMFLLFLVVIAVLCSFAWEKKYILLILMYAEAVVLMMFWFMVVYVWSVNLSLYVSLFMMLMAAIMAALGLVFVTVLSRKQSLEYLKNWFLS